MTELAVIEPDKKTVPLMEEPLVSMIVPIYDKPAMVLKRCLLSLEDQDYPNMEVVCVLDGPNKELEHIAAGFVSRNPEKFKLIEIVHAGACAARNAGFKESKGEIVSFFNSDYIAKPGMVKLWVDALLNNPDCGFAYAGYEYATQQRHFFPSGPFDPWQLEIENYIDCGFPLWRKYAVEWDPTVKSLQDWDFWLRVIKTHKVKGFFMAGERSFLAQIPQKNGLSDDSSNNWIDRVTYVKQKNGIPLRDILVTSLGASNHAKEIAKLIGADYRDYTFDKPSNYKALYMIGFYIKPNEQGLNEHARRLAIFKERYPEAKRIVHFVGADIYWLRKFPWDSLQYLAGALRQSCDAILSENQEAHDELEKFGIPSQIVPIPSYSTWEVKPLSKDFSVSLYLVENGNGTDFDKYCYEQTLSIVRGMPDVKFTGYGPGGQDVRYPNFKHMGFIPREKWPEYVYSQSCLLRLVRHDTLPMAGTEFLMAGRPFVTNIPMKFATGIDTSGKDDISKWDTFGEGLNAYNWPRTKKRIMQTIRRIQKDRIGDVGGSDFYRRLLDKETYVGKIKELCHVA